MICAICSINVLHGLFSHIALFVIILELLELAVDHVSEVLSQFDNLANNFSSTHVLRDLQFLLDLVPFLFHAFRHFTIFSSQFVVNLLFKRVDKLCDTIYVLLVKDQCDRVVQFKLRFTAIVHLNTILFSKHRHRLWIIIQFLKESITLSIKLVLELISKLTKQLLNERSELGLLLNNLVVDFKNIILEAFVRLQ